MLAFRLATQFVTPTGESPDGFLKNSKEGARLWMPTGCGRRINEFPGTSGALPATSSTSFGASADSRRSGRNNAKPLEVPHQPVLHAGAVVTDEELLELVPEELAHPTE